MDNFMNTANFLKNNSWRDFVLRIFLLLMMPLQMMSLEPPLCEPSPSVIQALMTIDSKERDILKFFFQSLFASGDFAYTLFGNKPIALIDQNLEFAFFEYCKGARRRKVILELEGWKVWNKHSHLFPTTQFSFTNNKSKCWFSGTLISKKNSQKIINEHDELFRTISEPSCIIENMIDRMNNMEDRTKEFPEHYFQCLGILLGYGQKNAQAFEQNSVNQGLLTVAPFDLKKYSSSQTEDLIDSIRINIQYAPLPSKIYCPKVEDLLNKVSERKQSYGSITATHRVNPLCPVRTPGFMAIKDNPETEEIINAYDSLREKLVQIYYSDRFLEIILTRLTSTE